MIKAQREPRAAMLWDLPVRVVHWSFAALMPALWWTAHSGRTDLHKLLGIVMLGLVVFRLLWGLFGSRSARLASFVRMPGAVLAYLRGNGAAIFGHNPLGGWSVLAMLALLGTQAAIGLFTQDVDGIESGPLSYLVSYDTADRARHLHELGFNLLLALVVLHLAAIAYYTLIRRHKLIRPMITGRQELPEGIDEPHGPSLARFVLCAGVAAAFAWWIWHGAPGLPVGASTSSA